jgi:hypothetical protein
VKPTVTGLNRGGNRAASHDLYAVMLTRLRRDPRTSRSVHGGLGAGCAAPIL